MASALWRSGVRIRALWPFHLYGLIVLVGTAKLMAWERMCRRDPTLPEWPGEGLYSTPLWEWIAFTYLIGIHGLDGARSVYCENQAGPTRPSER